MTPRPRRGAKIPRQAGQLTLALVPNGPCSACGASYWHRPLLPTGEYADTFGCMACHVGCACCAPGAASWDEGALEGGRDARRRKG